MRFAALLLCVLVGCSPELMIGDDVFVTCGPNGECPNDLTCVNGVRCAREGQVEGLGVTPLVPVQGSTLHATETTLPTVFGWRAVEGAAGYALTIARDADFRTLVDGSPFAAEDASTTVPLTAGSYWWRVTSDVTQGDPVTAFFGIVGDTLHVHCAPADNCEPRSDVVELGTQQNPFRRISTALAAVKGIGATTIAVADRGGGEPYLESLTLVPGVNIAGGFTAAFEATNGRTPVIADNAAVYAVGITVPTRISGLSFQHSAPLTGSSTAARMIGNSSALVFDNVEFRSPTLVTNVVQIEDSRDPGGVVINDSLIDGVYDSGRSDRFAELSVVTLVNGGAMQLTGGTRVTGSAERVYVTALVMVDAARRTRVSVHNSAIASSRCPNNCYAIRADGGATIATAESALELIGSGAGEAVVIMSTSSNVTIDRSTLIARNFLQARGVRAVTSGTLRATSSVVFVDDDDVGTARFGLELTSLSDVIVVNNTIRVGRAEGEERGIDLNGAIARIVNNLIISNGRGCNEEALCHAAIRDSQPGTALATRNNAFVGWDCLIDDGGGDYECLALNAIRQNKTNEGNIEPASVSLDANGKPTSPTPLGAAGHPTRTTNCAMQSCGDLKTDRAGVDYANPPTIGAYEP